MTPSMVLSLFGEALWLVILMVSVLVVPSLLVGLVIAMFQAATQINEQTLSFLPRLLMTLLSLIIAGPWLLSELLEFSHRLVASLGGMLG